MQKHSARRHPVCLAHARNLPNLPLGLLDLSGQIRHTKQDLQTAGIQDRNHHNASAPMRTIHTKALSPVVREVLSCPLPRLPPSPYFQFVRRKTQPLALEKGVRGACGERHRTSLVRMRQSGPMLATLVLLLAPASLHGDSPSTVVASANLYSPLAGCFEGGKSGVGGEDGAALRRVDRGRVGILTAGESQLRLRGGKGNIKAGRSKSVTRSGSPLRSASVQKKKVSRKKPMKPHNLGPAEWMKKLKRPELQRKEVSMKGFARGRKKAVFHFWTKSKIKEFTQKRIAFRAKRRDRKAMTKLQLEGNNKAEIIHAWARGWKTKFSKWLPSAAEQRALDETAAVEAREAAKKAFEEKQAAGDDAAEEGGGEDGDGEEGGENDDGGGAGDGGGGAGEEEEDDFMGGFGGGDSDGSGLF